MRFALGMRSLEVCKVIVEHQREISNIRLIGHEVGNNWRVLYQTPQQKLEKLSESFSYSNPLIEKTYSRDEFAGLTLDNLPKLSGHATWSIASKVTCFDGSYRHIPMMNFHPEDKTISKEEIKNVTGIITGEQSGVLLDSGRFFHYYGDFLLNEDDWLNFLGNFLMPCVFVSPRYIGHVLRRGYCTLRLTADSTYKPKIPEVTDLT